MNKAAAIDAQSIDTMTVGTYLLTRLKSLGCDHIFGIPGDFILPFFDQIMKHEIKHISPSNEFNGSYAADGYARIKGLAAMAFTYGPGAFSTVNAIAGAYAEHIPLVLISGGPLTTDYQGTPRKLHHVIENKLEASVELFKPITVSARVLLDPSKATEEIDQALGECLAHKRPVYLEIPRDIQIAECTAPKPWKVIKLNSDPNGLEKAVACVVERIKQSKQGAILPGHLIHSERLQDSIIKLTELTGYIVGSMMVGKADYMEHLPYCIGPYQGGGSPTPVKERIENSDVILCLGMVESDFNLAGFSDNLIDANMIRVTGSDVTVGDETFSQVQLADFVETLIKELPVQAPSTNELSKHFPHSPSKPYQAEPEKEITTSRLFDRLVHFFRKGDIISADAGGYIEMIYSELPPGTRFIGQGYWASIGFGMGAGVGASFTSEDNRLICIEGDGSLQMTAQEISTLVRYQKNAVIIVLNNRGYTAERLIHEGDYNDIQNWHYERLAEVFGGEKGVEVRTESDLEKALELAETREANGPLMINVHLDPLDVSESFELMSAQLRYKNH